MRKLLCTHPEALQCAPNYAKIDGKKVQIQLCTCCYHDLWEFNTEVTLNNGSILAPDDGN